MLHYNITGNGEPVILVHGFPNDGNTWNSIIPSFSAQYKLIIPDLPGAGQSAFVENLTLEMMAEGLKEVLEKEQVEAALFVGHSMGGYTILEFAQLFPQMVKGLSLVHSLASSDTEEKKEHRKKSIKLLENGTEGKYNFLKAMAINLFSESYLKEHPGAVDIIVENGLRLSTASLAAFYTAIMNRSDKTTWLKGNNIPMQWIVGNEDKATPEEAALKECTLAIVNDIQIYKPCGHMSMMEQPDRLATDLINFANFI